MSATGALRQRQRSEDIVSRLGPPTWAHERSSKDGTEFWGCEWGYVFDCEGEGGDCYEAIGLSSHSMNKVACLSGYEGTNFMSH